MHSARTARPNHTPRITVLAVHRNSDGDVIGAAFEVNAGQAISSVTVEGGSGANLCTYVSPFRATAQVAVIGRDNQSKDVSLGDIDQNLESPSAHASVASTRLPVA